MSEVKLDYINQKMPLYKGCTFFEIGLILFLSYIIALCIFGSLSIVFFGTVLPAVSLNIFPTLFFALTILNLISHYKVGKPLGYAELKLKLYLIRLGLAQNPYIKKSQKWGVGRYD